MSKISKVDVETESISFEGVLNLGYLSDVKLSDKNVGSPASETNIQENSCANCNTENLTGAERVYELRLKSKKVEFKGICNLGVIKKKS